MFFLVFFGLFVDAVQLMYNAMQQRRKNEQRHTHIHIYICTHDQGTYLNRNSKNAITSNRSKNVCMYAHSMYVSTSIYNGMNCFAAGEFMHMG